jgi:hypothetical protein
VLFDVLGRRAEDGGIVPELPETAVAVEAEKGANSAGLVVVVDVTRRSSPADRAESAGLDLTTIGAPFVSRGHIEFAPIPPCGRPVAAVATVLMASPSMFAAVEGVAVTGIPISREFGDRPVGSAVSAELAVHVRRLRN